MNMTSNPTDRPSIVAAIVVQDGKVLMVRRRVREDTLSWQFPAGESEAGETAEDTAIRETQEETALDVAADKVLGERIHPATGRHMMYVACHVVGGTARVADEDEIAELAWCGLNELHANVPTGLFPAVDEYLTGTLASA
jgi:8-oxo-dGTP diphosphatase